VTPAELMVYLNDRDAIEQNADSLAVLLRDGHVMPIVDGDVIQSSHRDDAPADDGPGQRLTILVRSGDGRARRHGRPVDGWPRLIQSNRADIGAINYANYLAH